MHKPTFKYHSISCSKSRPELLDVRLVFQPERCTRLEAVCIRRRQKLHSLKIWELEKGVLDLQHENGVKAVHVPLR